MKDLQTLIGLIVAIALLGCQASVPVKAEDSRAVISALYTDNGVTVDGKLDEATWQEATVYELNLGQDRAGSGHKLQQVGQVQLAWDQKFLYVAVHFEDRDIVAEGDRDQMHHYLHGDLAEVFIKPTGSTWYWELYITPHGKKTHLWFPGSGRVGLKSNDDYAMGLQVAAQIQGTLNDWRDHDSGWTGEMSIPIADLQRHGDEFGLQGAWTIMVARYNYCRYLKSRGPELSMVPQMKHTNFHYLEGYAELQLVSQ